MAIERTTHDYIRLGGITISVSSEAPDPRPAHTRVVDAIIKAVGKIEDSYKPTCDAIADTGEVICGSVNEADPKLGEPTGNPPAPLSESKPKLLIDIATPKDSSEGTARMISLTSRNLHEVFDEERAMRFVKGICTVASANDYVLVVPMNNDQVIMVEVLASCPVGHDKLVELAKQAIARVATVAGIDYVVSAR